MAKIALFPRPRDLPRGGFYINPSRRPPRSSPGAKKGLFPGFPREGPKRALFGGFWPNSRISGIWGSRAPRALPDPRRVPRGPGARGWCKTPLAGGSGPGPRAPEGSEAPSRAPGGPGGPFWGPRGSPGGPGGPSGRGFYINPSRRGPAVPRGPPSRGPGGLPSSGGGGKGVVPQPLICRGGGAHRRGCARGWPQARGVCKRQVSFSRFGASNIMVIFMWPEDVLRRCFTRLVRDSSDRGARGLRYASLGGRPPSPLFGVPPAPGRRWDQDPRPGEPRGPGARGWCKTLAKTGSRGAPGALKRA